MRSIAGVFLGSVLGVGTFVIQQSGYFNEVVVEEVRTPSRKIVYFEHEGIQNDITPGFRKLIKDATPFMRINNVCRITYDSPIFLVDQASSRSVIGLEFENMSDENGAKLLCAAKKEYKLTILPETACIRTKYEMKQHNLSVAFFVIHNKIYPSLQGKLAQHKPPLSEQQRNQMIEVYKFNTERNPTEIEFFVPTELQQFKHYQLHSKPLPPQIQIN